MAGKPNQGEDFEDGRRRQAARQRGATVCIWLGLALAAAVVASLATRAEQGRGAETIPSVSTLMVGGERTYTVQKGDSQTVVGARLGVDAGAIAAMNGLKPNAWLRIGQKLKIENRHLAPATTGDGIVINIPQRMLFYFRGGELKAAFPVAVGKSDWPTPVGNFRILEKVVDKTWVVPPSIQREMRTKGERVRERVPPGPANPLGNRWMRISQECGIHGTNAPASIYRFGTHGCIRLQGEAVDNLFGMVKVGTPVQIIYQPVLLGRIGGTIYLEAAPDAYAEVEEPVALARAMAARAGWSSTIDWKKAEQLIQAHDGVARAVGPITR